MADNSSQSPLPPSPPAVVVVVVPFLAQSHLNYALQLAHLIASYDIPVFYATSADHCRQAKLNYNGESFSSLTHLNFTELPMPPYLSPPADPNSSIPTHLQPCWDASLELRHPIAALLRQLSSSAKRVVVVYDPSLAYIIQDVNTIPNAESYSFYIGSAFSLRCMLNPCVLDQYKTNHPYVRPFAESFTPEMLKFFAHSYPNPNIKHGDIIHTSRALERSHLDLLKDEDENGGINIKQWAFAPLNPVRAYNTNTNNNNDKCLMWLDKQPRKSVLFISFGSTTSMKDEQVKELALGLKQSKQRFLWAMRDAEIGNVFNEDEITRGLKTGLPDGFEESVKEIGMITRNWAPQLEILGHSSVGAFMSHCGWNSIVESLSMGVPLVGWPMHSDQPYNALFVIGILKAGVMVKDYHKDLVGSFCIKEAIKELMASEEGEAMRKRAEEFGCELRNAVEEGGVSKVEVESFIAHITREII